MLKTMLPILCLGLLANTLSADIIHPESLNNGDKYRYAFVTSTTRDATSYIIADYDAHVQLAIRAADPSGLGAISWRAWGSTSTVDAIVHLSTTTATWDGSDVPIYLIHNGGLVANNFADLTDGSLSHPIHLTELAQPVDPYTQVWTGTLPDGYMIEGFTLGTPRDSDAAWYGYAGPHIFDVHWTDVSHDAYTNQKHLYGFSDVITVGSAATVPEPSSLVLMTLGIGTLCVSRLRHRRRNTA